MKRSIKLQSNAAKAFDALREKGRIEKVIGAFIPLEADGLFLQGECPFCPVPEGKNMRVNTARQLFHCFSCHKGGDVFTFVQEHESASPLEAVGLLALGIELSPQECVPSGVDERGVPF